MRVGLLNMVETCRDQDHIPRATLPLADTTLGSYQMRELAKAGAEKIVCVADTVPGQLMALRDRAEGQGIEFAMVRTPKECAEQLAETDRVMLLADGLYVHSITLQAFFAKDGDALAVLNAMDDLEAHERIDLNHRWAGMARLRGSHLKDLASLPDEFDIQSAALRAGVQRNYDREDLPAHLLASGRLRHLRRSEEAEDQQEALLSSAAKDMPFGLSNLVLVPLARAISHLIWRRGWPSPAMLAGQILFTLAALVLGWYGFAAASLGVMCFGFVFAYLRTAIFVFREPGKPQMVANIALALGAGLTVVFSLMSDSWSVLPAMWLYVSIVTLGLYTVMCLRFTGDPAFALQASCDALAILLIGAIAAVFGYQAAWFMLLSGVYALVLAGKELLAGTAHHLKSG